jgi:succinate dehydrogenase / fumarate reductase cytochrome b subunit
MADNRPKNLDLTTIKLPVMGLTSILHRISAVIIWAAMIFLLPVLYISLESIKGFDSITTLINENVLVQLFLWGFLTALGYYIVGGLKHIIQEFGYFETLNGGAFIAKLAIGLGICLSLLSGFWIWG